MYAWIWRHIPGSLTVRIAAAFGLLLLVVIGLLFGVFPILEPHLPFNHVTVDQPAATPSPSP